MHIKHKKNVFDPSTTFTERFELIIHLIMHNNFKCFTDNANYTSAEGAFNLEQDEVTLSLISICIGALHNDFEKIIY